MSKDYRQLAASMRAYRSRVKKNTIASMRKAGYQIAQSAKRHLAANGSVSTGALNDSIDYYGKEDAHGYTMHITADATNADGTKYAEFVEFGTGIYNEHGDGRQTPWRYQDSEGQWHTTSGQVAKPFIRPAFAEHLGELRSDIRKSIRVDGKGI